MKPTPSVGLVGIVLAIPLLIVAYGCLAWHRVGSFCYPPAAKRIFGGREWDELTIAALIFGSYCVLWCMRVLTFPVTAFNRPEKLCPHCRRSLREFAKA
jgi:hypothetical protein